MSASNELRTERLLLRRWLPADRPAFAALNADPQVMVHFPRTLTAEESDQFVERAEQHFEDRGFGLWAVEVVGVVPFIGYGGLAVPQFEAHFTPCVEIGWRLSAEYWGHGYATEAARASLTFGFQTVGLSEIVSFTVPENVRSRRVMERVGMTRNPADDFDHPTAPERLKRHVLYRVQNDARGAAHPETRR